jgi:hypothetical protein
MSSAYAHNCLDFVWCYLSCPGALLQLLKSGWRVEGTAHLLVLLHFVLQRGQTNHFQFSPCRSFHCDFNQSN